MNAKPTLALPEFVAIIALLMASLALATDATLPAIPHIASELSPDDPNRVQLVVLSFLMGMGIGTIFAGPLSDAFGRRKIILGGVLVFMAAALVAYFAQSLEVLLVARLVQGIGAGGPRIAPTAMV